jgi:hypothetical protein
MEFSTGNKFGGEMIIERVNQERMTKIAKDWVMVLLTLTFVVLYGLALLGRLRPLADVSMVSRLEPIIFLTIGYYFGRVPGQQIEQTLKDELDRQTQRANAAQQARETVLQLNETLEEKVKNARTALSGYVVRPNTADAPSRSSSSDSNANGFVTTALNILKS